MPSFGPFELDLARDELRKEGESVKLPPQPFKLLALLVARPDEIVTREEIQEALWEGDTFVDFEHGINTCVKQIRSALGDDPEHPRYVLTVPKRGYRFVGVVEPDADRASTKRPAKSFVLWLGAAALIGAVWIAVELRNPLTDPSFKLSILPPEGTTFGQGFRLSPDGTRIAFVATDARGQSLIRVRPLDSLEARVLPGTEAAFNPFWSADGNFIGFFAEGYLKKVAASGGAPEIVARAPLGRGGTWNRDDVIVFNASGRGPLYRIPASGGTPTLVTTTDLSSRCSHRHPYFLPDGRHFLFTILNTPPEESGIYLGSLDRNEREPVRLFDAAQSAVYSSSGHILFTREGTLFAQPFDAGHGELSGQPYAIADGLESLVGLPSAVSVADNGVLAYWQGAWGHRALVWLDRNGNEIGRVRAPPGIYLQPELSPDEARVATQRNDPVSGVSNIWLLDSAKRLYTRFTFFPSVQPVWSPDGSDIAFSSNRRLLYRKASGGAGVEELLYESPAGDLFLRDWSPDGTFLMYEKSDPEPEGQLDVWILPVEEDDGSERKPFAFLDSERNERQPRFSPDGRWIAYASDASGSYNVYVARFPDGGGNRQISTDGGTQPRWRADGMELYYVSRDGHMMAVPVRADAAGFEHDAAQALFSTRFGDAFRNDYAVTSDGQRFLVVYFDEEAASQPITVVLNWTETLTR